MKLFDKIQHTSSDRIESTKGATTLQKLGANWATPESRTRSARDLRANPESRAKPEKEWGRGLGRGLGELLPIKVCEFRTSIRSIWCLVEKEILKKSTFQRKQKCISHVKSCPKLGVNEIVGDPNPLTPQWLRPWSRPISGMVSTQLK